ncbi:RadC family protein [Macrococcus armenti]|uniref:DNA repair protein RadC n=1 Tax=Macrococcus armenti TaxID=2875764 RepID=A0ABY3ZSG8_9STAP|nr:DNA repair protein RadC [Macrococcus armenti]UOB19833.1 DNA repair protein RadC [Macrococcus armenti]
MHMIALESDKPRERLLSHGAAQLTNQELLSLIIGSGVRDESVYMVANKLLHHTGSIKELRYMTFQELIKIKGIGEKKAALILAVVELGIRMHSIPSDPRLKIKSPGCAANLLMERMRYMTQEHFVVLSLNTKNMVIYESTIFIGSLNASIVHPREIFKEAVKRSAASIIIVHNHPSGDPEPSYEDIEATRRLIKCGELFGIDVLDHIIIGDGNFVSIKEKGIL